MNRPMEPWPGPRAVSVEESLRHVIDASKALLSVLATDRLLEVLMERAIELTRADRGFLMLADPGGGLSLRVGRRFDLSLLDGSAAVISRSVAEEVFRTRRSILSANALGDDQLRNRRSVLELRLMTVMCAPILAKDRILGVLYVDSLQVRTAFDANSLAAFQALADFAAIALENARLYGLATTDPKTGLANAGCLRARLEDALASARLGDRPMALVLIDLDHFKRVNDTHGHPAGDRVLQEVAAILRRSVRGDDLAARFGGEEFALVLGPSPAGETAVEPEAVAERVRQAIARHEVNLSDGSALRVTASLGVAGFPNREVEHVDDLIALADRCLYEAKRGGRNRVVAETVLAPSGA